MALAISITVKDRLAPVLARVKSALQPASLYPVIGRSATNTIRNYLFGLNASRANALGGPRTNFYASAGRATHFDEVDGGVTISINQVGMAQRYFGGTITPKTAKYLTIPARAEAYGKRAGEFAGLVVLWGRNGPYGLAIGDKTFVQKTIGAGRNRGAVSTRQVASSQQGAVLFWLVKSVTQAADPTVLPPKEEIYQQIGRDVAAVINRAKERSGGDN